MADICFKWTQRQTVFPDLTLWGWTLCNCNIWLQLVRLLSYLLVSGSSRNTLDLWFSHTANISILFIHYNSGNNSFTFKVFDKITLWVRVLLELMRKDVLPALMNGRKSKWWYRGFDYMYEQHYHIFLNQYQWAFFYVSVFNQLITSFQPGTHFSASVEHARPNDNKKCPCRR